MAHPHHASAEHQHHHGDLAELLDLDAEALGGHLDEVTAFVAAHADRPVRHIVDLGAGTGTGTYALLRRFPDATATAVDATADMLHRIEAKAGADRDRLRTVVADLDHDWPDTGPADLIWASSSLHHMADLPRVWAGVRATLAPGGVLAVIEMDSFPRFLPDDLRPLEDRAHVLRDEEHAAVMPNRGGDWAALLRDGGFTVRAEHAFEIEVAAPLPGPALRYARMSLNRLRNAVADRLDDADRAAFAALLDSDDGPEHLSRRGDLTLRNIRRVWISSPES